MAKHLSKILTAAAVFFVLCAFFPVFPILETFVLEFTKGSFEFTANLGTLLLQFAASVVAALVGYVLNWLLDKVLGVLPKSRKFFSVPVYVLTVGGIFALFYLYGQLYVSICMIVYSSLYFFIGRFLYSTKYDVIFKWNYFYIALGAQVVAVVFMFFAKTLPRYGGVFIFAAFCLLMTLLFFFGINQSNINSMMKRRRHNMSDLPTKVRSYNLKLYGGVAAILIAAVCLIRPLTWVANWFFGVIKAGLSVIVKWLSDMIRRLANHYLPDGAIDKWVGADQGGIQAGVGTGNQGDIASIIVIILICLALVFLIVKNRKAIVKLFKAMLKKLSAGSTSRKESGDDFDAYVDEDDSLDPDEIPEEEVDPTAANLRAWRKAYRKFCGMAESTETFRLGYKLLLNWLKIRKIEFKISNTTLEIYDIVQQESVAYPDFAEPTDNYNELRYGEREFDVSTMAGLKETLSLMAEMR